MTIKNNNNRISQNVPNNTNFLTKYTATSPIPNQKQFNKKRKVRRKNAIWFNPPFSSNVKTNIPKEFFRIVEKYFKYPHKE